MSDKNEENRSPSSSSPSSSQASPACFKTPLLQSLFRGNDFTAAGSNKRSVRDCLRYRSLPRPEVKRILKDDDGARRAQRLSLSDLRVSSASLLATLIDLKRRAIESIDSANTLDSSPSSCSRSTLWYVSRLSTATSFIQLLLEYGDNRPDREENAELEATAKVNREAERNKMVMQLVRGLVGFCCSCLERQLGRHLKSKDADGEGSDDVREDEVSAVLLQPIKSPR